jgi:cell division protein FtsZ
MNDEQTLLVEPTESGSTPSIIMAVGVGGGGGNAVCQMYREGIAGVRFLVCNTDGKALEDAAVPDKLQLGPGLGAGGRPERGR